jgi:hypothetical protein
VAFWAGLVLGWRRRGLLRLVGAIAAAAGVVLIGGAVFVLGAAPALVLSPSVLTLVVGSVVIAWRPVRDRTADWLRAARARRLASEARSTAAVDNPSSLSGSPAQDDAPPVDEAALRAVLNDLRLADETTDDPNRSLDPNDMGFNDPPESI